MLASEVSTIPGEVQSGGDPREETLVTYAVAVRVTGCEFEPRPEQGPSEAADPEVIKHLSILFRPPIAIIRHL